MKSPRSAARKGVVFHTDAVQAVGKMPIKLAGKYLHFLSLSGHKLHASKGVGALYVNRNSKFHPMVVGGPQEGGRRAGTDNVASIVGLGKAAELAASTWRKKTRECARCAIALNRRIRAQLEEVAVNGDTEKRLPEHFEPRLPRRRCPGHSDQARSGRRLLFVRLVLHDRRGRAFARPARDAHDATNERAAACAFPSGAITRKRSWIACSRSSRGS